MTFRDIFKNFVIAQTNTTLPNGPWVRYSLPSVHPDGISECTTAKAYNFVDMPDFNQAWFDAFLENVGMLHTISHFAWFLAAARRLPQFLRHKLLPTISRCLEFRICLSILRPKSQKCRLTPAHVALQRLFVSRQRLEMSTMPWRGNEYCGNFEIFHANVRPEEKSLDRLSILRTYRHIIIPH